MYFAHLALAIYTTESDSVPIGDPYSVFFDCAHPGQQKQLHPLCYSNSVRPLVVGILSFIPPLHPYVFFVGLSLIDSCCLFCHTFMHIISRLLRMHQFRFLHDVTKIQTKKLSILLSLNFGDVM